MTNKTTHEFLEAMELYRRAGLTAQEALNLCAMRGMLK